MRAAEKRRATEPISLLRVRACHAVPVTARRSAVANESRETQIIDLNFYLAKNNFKNRFVQF